MAEERLVTSIREKMLDFQITVSDLKAPTGKFVQSYFINFLGELGVNVENFHLTENQMAKMTCPNSILHVVLLIQLFGAVDEIAKHIFVKDFSLHDLTRPKSKRILYILNHFDSFHSYADMLAGGFQSMLDELLVKKQEYKKLLGDVNNLQEEVRRQSNVDGLNEVLRQEIEELKKKVTQKHQVMSKLVKKTLEVDSSVEKLEMKHLKVSSECEQASDQVTKLQTNIVSSPEVDQISLKLRNLELKKCESKKMIEELQNTAQELCTQIHFFHKQLSDHEQGTQEIHTIVELATQNKMLVETKQALEKREPAVANKEIDAREMLAKKSNKIKQLDEQKKILKTETEQDLAAIKKKTEEMEKEIAKQREKVGSYVDLKKKITEMEQELQKKVEDNNKMCDVYDEIYHDTINELNAQLDKMMDLANGN